MVISNHSIDHQIDCNKFLYFVVARLQQPEPPAASTLAPGPPSAWPRSLAWASHTGQGTSLLQEQRAQEVAALLPAFVVVDILFVVAQLSLVLVIRHLVPKENTMIKLIKIMIIDHNRGNDNCYVILKGFVK